MFWLCPIDKLRTMFDFYFSKFFFLFDVSIFCSTIFKQKGSSKRRNWTGKVFYKEMFVKSIKSNQVFPWGTSSPPLIKHFFHFPGSDMRVQYYGPHGLFGGADHDFFSALRNTTQSVFRPETLANSEDSQSEEDLLHRALSLGIFPTAANFKYLGNVIAKTISRPSPNLRRNSYTKYFVSCLKWDKQMMVVSRLGSRTNNLYIQRQSFIWELGYTYYKYYQFTVYGH